MPKVFIHSLTPGYEYCFQKGFEFLGEAGVIKPTDRVCLKPNFTFPTFRPGVMTTLEAVKAAILFLKNFTPHVTLCESDSGGYNRFSMDEVFKATGIAEFAQHCGVKVVNMSFAPSRPLQFSYRRKHFSVPLPRFLLEETDLLITMPVPKVHLHTIVSIALKNQWGMIQEIPLRWRLHPYFKEVVYQINKALPRTLAIVDGKYGLTRSGPMRGDVVELNWILISDNIYYTDYVVTDLMGFDYRKIPYLKYIFQKEGISSLEGVDFNTDYRQFRSVKFYLKREWTDYPGVLTFHSEFFAYIGYESFLAKPLHWLLYKFREPFF